jgi:cellobiose-specific phosphotransferase system component IIA
MFTSVIQGEARESELAIDLNFLIAQNHLKTKQDLVERQKD